MRPASIMLIVSSILYGCCGTDRTAEEKLVARKAACEEFGGTFEYMPREAVPGPFGIARRYEGGYWKCDAIESGRR